MKGVILTGAGISAESGVPVFRGDDGLWEGHRVEDVATPEGFHRNPDLVHEFYNLRRRRIHEVTPNAAHKALARLESEWNGNLTLITQNIDDLHERAGSRDVLHMHGEILKSRCEQCDQISSCAGDLSLNSVCEACGANECLRPHVVWFGEMPFYLDKIEKALSEADWFVAIGTSGRVYPAAGFVSMASYAGAHTVEINLDEAAGSELFSECRRGKAGDLVPVWVDELLE